MPNIYLIVGGGFVVILLLVLLLVYNSLIARKNGVEQAFSSIDAYLKKRFDLIPNIVAAVSKYMDHERGTLKELTELRARAQSGSLPLEEKIRLANQAQRAFGQLAVQVEAYPNLKADEQFLMLQRSLNEVEEQLVASRRAYNAAVTEFNNAVEMFPSSVLAMMIGYGRKQVLETPDEERRNVDVKKLFNG